MPGVLLDHVDQHPTLDVTCLANLVERASFQDVRLGEGASCELFGVKPVAFQLERQPLIPKEPYEGLLFATEAAVSP